MIKNPVIKCTSKCKEINEFLNADTELQNLLTVIKDKISVKNAFADFRSKTSQKDESDSEEDNPKKKPNKNQAKK
jgi:hypothetical protein